MPDVEITISNLIHSFDVNLIYKIKLFKGTVEAFVFNFFT